MAVDGRTNVRHEDVFPVPVLVPVPVLLPGVEPAENFDKIKAAREAGLRVWLVSILDPSAKQGRREIKVKVPAEYQPGPASGGDRVPGGGLQGGPWWLIPHHRSRRPGWCGGRSGGSVRERSHPARRRRGS
jgi:hypothetical protein